MILATTPLSTLSYCRPFTVPRETRVGEALELARRAQIHHLPITERHIPIGFVCTCDIDGIAEDRLLSDLMRPPVTIDREATALEAAHLMRERRVGSVLLTSGDTLFGIVTRGDLLRTFPQAETQVGLSRCACCGLTRHLRAQADGSVSCIYCAGIEEPDWLLCGAAS